MKNLEKKYSKCQEGTPLPHNWKNILCLFFMFHAMFLEKKYLIAESCGVLARAGKWTAWAKIIQILPARAVAFRPSLRE